MKGKILFILLLSFLFSKFTSILNSENNPEIKIMCIGDSITDGFGIEGSYRKFLYNGLTKKGYNINMIGSKNGGGSTYTDEEAGEVFLYDDDNTGYSTFTIKSYEFRSGIYEKLIETDALSQQPDIVILQIGTNNIIDNRDSAGNSKDFDILIDYILENIPSTSTLFVTTIPPVDPNREEVYSWFNNYRYNPSTLSKYTDKEVEANVESSLKYYNSDITSKIKSRQLSGQNVRTADVNSVFTNLKYQLNDGVHPNNVGYKAMGEYWTEIIENYLKEKNIFPDNTDYKPTRIDILELPKGIIYKDVAMYTPTGHVIFVYKKESDEDEKKLYIGVMNDDGTNLKEIWGGIWEAYYKSNGIRLMPFDDNKRVLTGDYILECTPNIDECTSSKLLPIIYPEELLKMPEIFLVWSEVIISQDLEHMGWSTLSSNLQDFNFIAKINKNENNYTLSNIQVVSSINFAEVEGTSILTALRGGEVKQFVNGGEAMTLAGSGSSGLAKSVFQELKSDKIYPISQFPGYEETTIISPDGKLGIVMTTRFSPKTSSEILGIMPRPFSALTTGNMNIFSYTHGVTKVRKTGKGNIGPAVINIEESLTNPKYMGYDMHSDWSFCSPISWHPNSKKAMFSEISTNDVRRIRIVSFDNYKPSEIIKAKPTPDNIPYAKKLEDISADYKSDINKVIKGKEGYIVLNKTEALSRLEYVNYSDDGKIFYNGFEQFNYVGNQYTGRIISNVTMNGSKKGKMDLMLTMNMNGDVVYKMEGEKVSYGYVEYDGTKLTIEDSFNNS